MLPYMYRISMFKSCLVWRKKKTFFEHFSVHCIWTTSCSHRSSAPTVCVLPVVPVNGHVEMKTSLTPPLITHTAATPMPIPKLPAVGDLVLGYESRRGSNISMDPACFEKSPVSKHIISFPLCLAVLLSNKIFARISPTCKRLLQSGQLPVAITAALSDKLIIEKTWEIKSKSSMSSCLAVSVRQSLDHHFVEQLYRDQLPVIAREPQRWPTKTMRFSFFPLN